jgi:hypothetical protein
MEEVEIFEPRKPASIAGSQIELAQFCYIRYVETIYKGVA